MLVGVALLPFQNTLINNNVQANEPVNTNVQILEIPIPETRQHRVIRRYQAVSSWYRHGHTTANGEQYRPYGLTTAHKTLPFNTRVRLTNPRNGRSVIVRVNDRGPFIEGREFDMSLGTAIVLDMVDTGVTRLNIEILR
jgi:rare lipoprotein A